MLLRSTKLLPSVCSSVPRQIILLVLMKAVRFSGSLKNWSKLHQTPLTNGPFLLLANITWSITFACHAWAALYPYQWLLGQLWINRFFSTNDRPISTIGTSPELYVLDFSNVYTSRENCCGGYEFWLFDLTMCNPTNFLKLQSSWFCSSETFTCLQSLEISWWNTYFDFLVELCVE